MKDHQYFYKRGDAVVNRYTVLEHLGFGGTGEVFRVSDTITGMVYALKSFYNKVIPEHVPSAKLKGILENLVPRTKGICQIHHFGEHRGRKYIVMDYLPGLPLATLISKRKKRGGALTLHETASVINAVSSILAGLPSYSVHGNIKPSNVIIQSGDLVSGSEQLPQGSLNLSLTDFGLIKSVPFSRYASIQLAMGDIYYYLSPEHVSCGGRVDQKADIYALGVLAYEMLTGKVPKKHYTPVSVLLPGMPPEVDHFVQRAISVEPSKRHAGYNIVRSEMLGILQKPDVGEVPGPSKEETTPTPKEEHKGPGVHPDDLLTEDITESIEGFSYPAMKDKIRREKEKPVKVQTPSETAPAPKEASTETTPPVAKPDPISEADTMEEAVDRIVEEVEREYRIKDLAQKESLDLSQRSSETPSTKTGKDRTAAPQPRAVDRLDVFADQFEQPGREDKAAKAPSSDEVDVLAPSEKLEIKRELKGESERLDIGREILQQGEEDLVRWIEHVEEDTLRDSEPKSLPTAPPPMPEPAGDGSPGADQAGKASSAGVEPGPVETAKPTGPPQKEAAAPPASAPDAQGKAREGAKPDADQKIVFRPIQPQDEEIFFDETRPMSAEKELGEELGPREQEVVLSPEIPGQEPEPKGLDPLGESAAPYEQIDQNADEIEQEMKALEQMFQEAEAEADRREEERQVSRNHRETEAPTPQESILTDEEDQQLEEEEPILEEKPETLIEDSADSFGKPLEEELLGEPEEDPFKEDHGEPKIQVKRRKRESESGPMPKVIAALIIGIVILMALLVLYRVKFQPSQGTSSDEAVTEKGSEEDFFSKLGLSGTKPEKESEADRSKPGEAGLGSGMDEDLKEILGLKEPDKPAGGPEELPNLIEKAKALMAKKHYLYPDAPENAVYVCRQILKIDPENDFAKKQLTKMAASFYNLATMEINNKRFEKAKDYMQRAAVIEPDNQEYQALLDDLTESVAGGAEELRCPSDMVFIPKGKFLFGSAEEDPMKGVGEKDNVEVELAAYCIDLYEWPNKKGEIPDFQVTWYQASSMCEAAGKRLCSEMEWEMACKGKQNFRFPYGNNWDESKCNTETAEGKDRQLNPSGSLPVCVSGYGVYDMSGNLKEWTSSRWASGLEDYSVRGGGYRSPTNASRCAVREANNPQIKTTAIGFRCCKSMTSKRD